MPAHSTPAKGLPGPGLGLGRALCLLAQRRKSVPVLGPFGADAILLFTQRRSVPKWPEDCGVIAEFPSHLSPMLPSNKFYSPYVDRLYRKCSQKYIRNFLGIDDRICIQHSDVNSRSSPTFFQFRRQSPVRIVPPIPYFTASFRHIWAQFSNQRDPASRSC